MLIKYFKQSIEAKHSFKKFLRWRINITRKD